MKKVQGKKKEAAARDTLEREARQAAEGMSYSLSFFVLFLCLSLLVLYFLTVYFGFCYQHKQPMDSTIHTYLFSSCSLLLLGAAKAVGVNGETVDVDAIVADPSLALEGPSDLLGGEDEDIIF